MEIAQGSCHWMQGTLGEMVAIRGGNGIAMIVIVAREVKMVMLLLLLALIMIVVMVVVKLKRLNDSNN